MAASFSRPIKASAAFRPPLTPKDTTPQNRSADTFRQSMVFVTQEAWIGDPGNIAVAAQKLGHSLGIFAMPLHPHMKALQAKIQEKRMLGD